MFDGPAGGIRFYHDPLLVVFFHGIGDAHSGPRGRAGFWQIFDLRLRAVACDGDLGEIHVHSG